MIRALFLALVLLASCTEGDGPFQPCTRTDYWAVTDSVLVVDSTIVEGHC